MVANQLYELCEAVGPEATRTELVPAYVRLLRDNEAEVRIAAAGKVTKFCGIVSPQVAQQHILPCVKELSTDSSQHVRAALASVIMGMAPLLGKSWRDTMITRNYTPMTERVCLQCYHRKLVTRQWEGPSGRRPLLVDFECKLVILPIAAEGCFAPFAYESPYM